MADVAGLSPFIADAKIPSRVIICLSKRIKKPLLVLKEEWRSILAFTIPSKFNLATNRLFREVQALIDFLYNVYLK